MTLTHGSAARDLALALLESLESGQAVEFRQQSE